MVYTIIGHFLATGEVAITRRLFSHLKRKRKVSGSLFMVQTVRKKSKLLKSSFYSFSIFFPLSPFRLSHLPQIAVSVNLFSPLQIFFCLSPIFFTLIARRLFSALKQWAPDDNEFFKTGPALSQSP